MKTCFVFSLLWLVARFPLTAQPDMQPYSSTKLIFRLTDAEAAMLYRAKRPLPFQESLLHAVVDTFVRGKGRPELPPGHYISVSAEGEWLEFQPFSKNTLRILLLPNPRDFTLLVSDSSGRPLQNARVLLGGDVVPYDTALQCFRLPKRSKGGFLEVYADGETWFGSVQNRLTKPLWVRRIGAFGRSGPGKVLLAPLRGIRQLALTASGRGNAGRTRSREQFAGYIAFNQPRYQPGDTLRIKAYVADRKGRPWRDSLVLFMSATATTRSYDLLYRTVAPLTPGSFVYNLPLSDTLKLDQWYQLVFMEKPRGRKAARYNIRQNFRYEDYQLDEVAYTLEPAQPVFHRGEPAVLRLRATDANGQNVPDARTRLLILRQRVTAVYAPEVWAPDTLWRHEACFSTAGETLVELPDSIWPDAAMTVQVQANCLNSSGELQQKNASFSVDRRPFPLKTSLDAGFLTIESLTPDTALLQMRDATGRLDTLRIRLPWRAALSPGVAEYVVQASGYTTVVELPAASTAVRHSARRQQDSVVFSLHNPHRCAIRFQVYANRQLLETGFTQDSSWTWERPAEPGRSYHLDYQFIWRGASNRFVSEAIYYDGLLDIQLEQPDQVLPGEQIQVKIRVHDGRRRPLKGVNLTAGAYNQQFGNDAPYKAPDISCKPPRWQVKYNDFALKAIFIQSFMAPVTAVWYERLQLDSMLYYRLRYRGAGWYTESLSIPDRFKKDNTLAGKASRKGWGLPKEPDSFYLNRPQFAPYVIRKNLSQPIYLIYCNKKPVYYYGANFISRYSFYGTTGYNQIVLRTREGEYTLDSVFLTPGEKLEIAIDGDRFQALKAPFKVRFRPMPDTLTVFEQQTLRRSILLWRPQGPNFGHHFWSGPETIQIPGYFRDAGPRLIGPFEPGCTINYLRSGEFYSSFSFEPGFEYSISPGRERLFASKWPQGDTHLPKEIAEKSAGELAFGPQDIVAQDHLTPPEFRTPGADLPGLAALQWYFLRADTLLAFALLGDSTFGPYSTGRQNYCTGLPAGCFQLLVYSKGGYLHRRRIQLRADSLLCLDLSGATFDAARPDETLEFLFSNLEARPKAPWSPSRFSQWPDNMPWSGSVRGKLEDENSEPLIGVTIMAKQGGILVRGVMTDLSGEYFLPLPPGIYDLEFWYAGYIRKQLRGIRVDGGGELMANQRLESNSSLQEVIVRAYAVPEIVQDATSAGRTMSSREIRNLPTRNVNQIVTTTMGAYDDDFNFDIKIKGSRGNAIQYYVDGIGAAGSIGSRVADAEPVGAGIKNLEIEFAPPGALRAQFSDYAYWQPNLLTDANGEAWFQATFPDNITSWNTFVLGMDGRKRAGLAGKSTRTYKPLFASLALPRFAVAGDRFDAAGLVTNLGKDSVQLRTRFRLNEELISEHQAFLDRGRAEFARVQVPESGADSLQLSYELQSASVSDGEKRSIAVLPAGVLETTGSFLILPGDTVFTMQPDSLLGPVTVQAVDNALSLLWKDIQFLRDYPYGCNEQTASRLLGLLAEKAINDFPNPKQKHARSAADSLKNTALRNKRIRGCLTRLEQSQLADGSWGWWGGGTPNAWMTAYVLRALLKAEKEGYGSPAAVHNGLVWLRQALHMLEPARQLEALLLLREADVRFDCSPFLERLDTTTRITLHERLSYWRLQQLCGRETALDSLRKYLHATTQGGLYCGDENAEWYNCRAVNTRLAYDLASDAGWVDITQGIRQYWLSARSAAAQRNTIETAEIVQRLLPELLRTEPEFWGNKLEINGMVIDSFPAKCVFPAGAQSLTLRKTGKLPLYVSAYQQWNNPAPAPGGDLFAVASRLEQKGRPVDTLQLGEPADLIVEVAVRQLAEYVLIGVPIPAGCSVGEKQRGGLPEVHREYFRDHTAIFCESLPVGKYRFQIALEPRFSGYFTINPVRVEQMYFPALYGRNAVRRITVLPPGGQ